MSTKEGMAMTDRAKFLIALGRCVVVLTHVSACAILVLFGLMAAYSVTTGTGHLQLTEPWQSLLFAVFFALSPAVLLCWGVFCLAFAVLLRRRVQAGPLKQIAAILRVSVPLFGLGYYDSIVRGLADSGDSAVSQ
jgi:hypothetical protein